MFKGQGSKPAQLPGNPEINHKAPLGPRNAPNEKSAEGESVQQYWNRLYSLRNKILDYHKEAYLGAVVSIIVKTILYLHKDPIRILVVGGGDGHFSADVLPEVKKSIESYGLHLQLEVLETDMLDLIQKSSSPFKAINVLDLDKHFGPGSFDLAIGESMIHQLNQYIPDALGQIEHVLVPEGIFLHVQDTPPDYNFWLSVETMERLGLKDLGARIDLPDPRMYSLISKEAHLNLLHALQTCAQVQLLDISALPLSNTVTLEGPLKPHPSIELEDRNFAEFSLGNVAVGHVRDELTGELAKQSFIKYEGLMTMFSAQSLDPLLDFI